LKLKFEEVRVIIRPKNLKQVRNAAGLTLRELSSMCGLSIGFLNDLEFNRRTCSLEAFNKISVALGAEKEEADDR